MTPTGPVTTQGQVTPSSHTSPITSMARGHSHSMPDTGSLKKPSQVWPSVQYDYVLYLFSRITYVCSQYYRLTVPSKVLGWLQIAPFRQPGVARLKMIQSPRVHSRDLCSTFFLDPSLQQSDEPSQTYEPYRPGYCAVARRSYVTVSQCFGKRRWSFITWCVLLHCLIRLA